MTKIYRTVPVKDEDGVKGRLPEKEDYYYTNIGKFKYHIGDCHGWLDTHGHPVTHWLEEVKIPSDEQIDEGIKKFYDGREEVELFDFGIRCAKWMRDLILNNK